MDWITVTSTLVMAIATCFIAWFSYASIRLAKEIKNQDKNYRENFEELTKQHQKELGDLYQAIVIATLIGGRGSNTGVVKDAITVFNQHYKGDIKIFKDK